MESLHNSCILSFAPCYSLKVLDCKGQNKFGSFTALTLIEIKGAKLEVIIGVLNPDTGKPTARLDVVKAVDMVRLTEKDWLDERKKMISVCSNCHSEQYAREQLAMGDSIIKKADHLLAEAIEIVAALYKDHIIKKPDNYSFAYPDLLYFMQTGGGDTDNLSHIDQILFQMYMKHRMRTYQGFFHVNPDYAYWYGWAMMTKDLSEIKKTAKTMRSIHKLEK